MRPTPAWVVVRVFESLNCRAGTQFWLAYELRTPTSGIAMCSVHAAPAPTFVVTRVFTSLVQTCDDQQ
jgi:hypothetical protein